MNEVPPVDAESSMACRWTPACHTTEPVHLPHRPHSQDQTHRQAFCGAVSALVAHSIDKVIVVNLCVATIASLLHKL